MPDVMNSERELDAFYPIRTVAQLTGVNPVTLRAWERRYGLVRPQRTPKGHRLYSRQDIVLIRQVLGWLEQGIPIGQVSQRLGRGGQPGASYAAPSSPAEGWEHYRQRMYQSVETFDTVGLDSAYNEALSLYPVEVVTEQLLLPLLRRLGERWEGRRGAIAEEHFFATYLRNKLGARLHHQSPAPPRLKLLAACLPGEAHELGLLLFCLAAAAHGIGCVILGADMPLEEVAYAARSSRVDGILLSGSGSLEGENLAQGLSKLVNALTLPVFIGGDFSVGQQDKVLAGGAIPLGNQTAHALERLIGHFTPRNTSFT